jgi:hypothetical protein
MGARKGKYIESSDSEERLTKRHCEAWMMEATTPDKMNPQVASTLQSLTDKF